jgi:hypothetical protein
VLQVTLPTNFKAARFQFDGHSAMLRCLEAGIEAVRHRGGKGEVELPVKLKVHDSIFVPLAKWPMLLAGNYRCITEAGPRSISEAVHADPQEAHSVYDWVREVCIALGATAEDLVPFDRYAAAARTLSRPSSVARALVAGAPQIERLDRLVQAIAAQKGMYNPAVDEAAARVDALLAANRKAAA